MRTPDGGRRIASALVAIVASALVAAAPAEALPDPVACDGCWTPELLTSWQWQLQGRVDTSVDVQMYDVDAFDVSARIVGACTTTGAR